MRALAVVLLGGCATTASIGPLDRFKLEGGQHVGIVGTDPPIGPGAKLDLAIDFGAPAVEPADPPPWLTARGELRSAENEAHYGPLMYHNGRVLSVVHFALAVSADGKITLPGCPDWHPVGATASAAGKSLESCATKFVDDPQVILQVRENPTMAVKVAAPGWSAVLDYSPDMTVMNAFAYAGTHARSGSRGELDSQRVRLVTRDHRSFVIDVAAIATGERPDVPLRPGDLVSIEPH